MYMERDKKKQFQTDKAEQKNQIQYLQICLNTLITEVTSRIPAILGKGYCGGDRSHPY